MGRPRIVSLLPSATEIVCALGAGADLVGISHECDFPRGLSGLPVLTASRVSPNSSSAAIDAAVRELVQDALSIYTVDQQRLAELGPDLILTQDLCRVCAVSLSDVQSAVARLARRTEVQIVSLQPTRLQHVLQDIETVARALGLERRGTELRATLEARIAAIAERARRARLRPRVASVEWLEPLMLGGTWMPELIELAGGEALAARAGEPAPTLSAAEFAALRADIVLIKPCGFDVERTLREPDAIAALLSRLEPSARAFVTDGNAYFNRPGPRLVESLEILAAAIHPELFADFELEHRAALVSVK
ncbi:MAG TPA: ABC transporter substrate-binding protein [Polyangiaceae bacterium]|nr:ABC transporter substrate-binding protein [Polyangiaceae bacterium]